MNHYADIQVAYQGVLDQAMGRLRSTGMVHHVYSSPMIDAADGSGDDYESDAETEDDKTEEMKTAYPIDSPSPAHRTTPQGDTESLKHKREEQVAFIILARDNNKPDPYSTVSETHGPLPWSNVAKAYNERYGKSIASAAMEKRARQGRAAWIEKNPTYPSEIVYSKKIKRTKTNYPTITVAVTEQNQDFLAANNLQEGAEASDTCSSNSFVAGWLPSDYIRNSADRGNYADEVFSTLAQMVCIDVYNDQKLQLGSVIVNREDLRRNSPILRRLLDNESITQLQLHCWPLGLIEHYAECLSPERPAQLPERVLRNAVSVVELYCFAVQIEDDRVRALVLDHWRRLSQQMAEVNLELEDLNLLFNNTQHDDPAREFWAATVCAAGLADRVLRMGGCHYALIAHIQEVVAREEGVE